MSDSPSVNPMENVAAAGEATSAEIRKLDAATHDALVMEQVNAIRSEEARKPLVSNPPEVLSDECALVHEMDGNAVMLVKVKALYSAPFPMEGSGQVDLAHASSPVNATVKYSKIRYMRRDGNCFFRAASFGLFEAMLKDVARAERFIASVNTLKPKLVEDYSEFVEDFCDSVLQLAAKIRDSACTDPATLVKLLTGDESEYVICFFRYSISHYLRNHEEEFLPFVMAMDFTSVKDYCRAEVDAVARESDQVHIVAFARAFHVNFTVQYIDTSVGNAPTCHIIPESENEIPGNLGSGSFNSNSTSTSGHAPQQHLNVHLLYRPGHYDLLYV